MKVMTTYSAVAWWVKKDVCHIPGNHQPRRGRHHFNLSQGHLHHGTEALDLMKQWHGVHEIESGAYGVAFDRRRRQQDAIYGAMRIFRGVQNHFGVGAGAESDLGAGFHVEDVVLFISEVTSR